MAQLSIRDISLQFGGVSVLHSVSFEVDSAAIFGLVGPNGAGKTSLFNCISGLYRPSSGTILLDGEDTLLKAPWQLASMGLARTFQHPALQLKATVLENVLVGGNSRLTGGPMSWALRLPFTTRVERDLRKHAAELLDRLDLARFTNVYAGELAHGLHKRVELCRALLSRPKVLLLDEPAAGLSHGEVEELTEWITTLRSEFGLTILIVEHHMGMIAAVTDKLVVLNEGRLLMEGTAQEAQKNRLVIEAYLGKRAAANEHS
jgi:ABC-type branched-chain amino acid transport systems, ATPase component